MDRARELSAARTALFADSRSWASALLVEAALSAARARDDVTVVAVVDVARRAPRLGPVRAVAAELARRAFERRTDGPPVRARVRTLRGVARRYGTPLLATPGGDVHAPALVERLRALEPELALSLLAPRILRPELLALFRRAANYHNGLLPELRGVRATAWSIHRGDPVTGFTWHLMTPALDAGPVLLREELPLPADATAEEAEWEKTTRAAATVDVVLDRLVRGDSGAPQEGAGELVRFADVRRLRDVADPAGLSADELERRLRAFGMLTLVLAGRPYEVTSLRRAERAGRPLAFRTADGVLLEPARCLHLPLPVYRAVRRVRPRER